MKFSLGKFDAGGYYCVVEDGCVIAKSKSLRVVKRIALALAAVASASPNREIEVDLANVEDLKPAVYDESWP